MKNYILALVALIAATFSAYAQQVYDYTLLVNTKEGKVVEYEFKYFPVASFEGDELVITDDAHAESMRYNMADITNFTFKKALSGVENVTDQKADLRIIVTKEYLKVSGLTAGERVDIHNLTGYRVATACADADGYVCIELDNIGTGVFIASMPGNTFKFIR